MNISDPLPAPDASQAPAPVRTFPDSPYRLHQAFEPAGDQPEAIERLVERARSERIAVMCVESEVGRCHRQVVTEAALERCPSLEVFEVR